MVYSEQAGSGRLCDEVSSGQGPEQSDGVSHMTLEVIGPLTVLGHNVQMCKKEVGPHDS